jgi:hypothetical protein
MCVRDQYIHLVYGREREENGGVRCGRPKFRNQYIVLGKIGSGISDVVLEQSLEGFPGLRKRAVVGVGMVDCGERIQERAPDNGCSELPAEAEKSLLSVPDFCRPVCMYTRRAKALE